MFSLLEETGLPLVKEFEAIKDIPHTVSFFIRKMAQIKSFDELKKEQRPPEYIWDDPKELEIWFDKVFDYKSDGGRGTGNIEFFIDESEIEG